MNRKALIGRVLAGLVAIVLGSLIFFRVVPTAKSIFDRQIDTVVGGLFLLAGTLCVAEAIAKALGK